MKRANSFSSEILYGNNNNINKEKMFLSMKETLHHPLLQIKSKELLNHFYVDKNLKEKIQNENNILNLNQKNQLELTNNKKEENWNNNKKYNNENEYNNINLIDKEKAKYNGRNNIYNKYKKDSFNSEMIDFNTSPNTNPENNLDNIPNVENTNIINTEPIKQKTNFQSEKNALNEIKNIALNIKYKINSFKICENTSKLSIEQSYDNNNNHNKFYNTSINNLNNPILPFECINYSFTNIQNNPKRRNTTGIAINTNPKTCPIKSQDNSKSKSKDKNHNFNYRNYIQNPLNTKIIKPNYDIYNREMAKRKKKELKLEEIRKKEIEEELSELRVKPKINKNSKKMTKNKTPIYRRIKEIEKEKNNKIEKIKENVNKTNHEYFNKNNNKQKFNEDDFKKWLISNENWNVKKLIKLNNIKREVKIEEDLNNEELKFHPKINKNSEKIFKLNNNLSSKSVTDRLCYTKENREKYSQKNNEYFTFIPEINKDYQISDDYYKFMEKDQFQIYNKNLHKKLK